MLKRGSLILTTMGTLFISMIVASFNASADNLYRGSFSTSHLTTSAGIDASNLQKVHRLGKSDRKHKRHSKRHKHRRNRSRIFLHYSPFYDPFYDPFFRPYRGYPHRHYYRRPRAGITFYFGN